MKTLRSFATPYSSFLRRHRSSGNIWRVAIATDSKFLAAAPAFAQHFVSAEIKHFDYTDIESATQWLQYAE